MRLSIALLQLACCLFAQSAVFVFGRGCFQEGNSFLSDASYSCALQFFATGMEGKSVSLTLFDPVQGTYTTPDAPFDSEKAVVEFSARIHRPRSRASCLHLSKIQANFKAPYAIDSIDQLVLDSFEGDDPPTQDARGQCFKIEQTERSPVRKGTATVTSVYGFVYVDLWCALKQAKLPKPPGTPEQISFSQISSLHTSCS